MNKVKKTTKIPWHEVPKEILLDIAESTGLDPRKMKWIVIDEAPDKDV